MLVDRTVGMTLTDEIRTQNVPGVLARSMANREHGGRAWAFARSTGTRSCRRSRPRP
jgi:hypothetical protein